MVKHTLKLTNCLSVFDHFVGLELKGLNFRMAFRMNGAFYEKYLILFLDSVSNKFYGIE